MLIALTTSAVVPEDPSASAAPPVAAGPEEVRVSPGDGRGQRSLLRHEARHFCRCGGDGDGDSMMLIV